MESICYLQPEDHLKKGLWAHHWNLVKILFALILIFMIQSSHNFAHATTAGLSWHVQNYDLIGSVFFMEELLVFILLFFFRKFGIWAHKLFVKWVPGPMLMMRASSFKFLTITITPKSSKSLSQLILSNLMPYKSLSRMNSQYVSIHYFFFYSSTIPLAEKFWNHIIWLICFI